MSITSGRKRPDCPFVTDKSVPCQSFNFFRTPVCLGHDEDDRFYVNCGSGLFRCYNRPSGVEDGYHDFRYYDGKLHCCGYFFVFLFVMSKRALY